jgi:hypothetical protein
MGVEYGSRKMYDTEMQSTGVKWREKHVVETAKYIQYAVKALKCIIRGNFSLPPPLPPIDVTAGPISMSPVSMLS